MFKIGDFSQFTCVSVKQLRHYDEIGLLRPRLVDPFTSYRYYSADQLPRLNRILALRDLGFSLEQIARLLDDDLSIEQMRGMLRLRRAEIEQQMQREEMRLARVAARLHQIEAAETPVLPYDVVLRTVDPQIVAGIRQIVPTDGDELAALFDEVEQFAASQKVRAPSPPLMRYHDAEYREGVQDIEVMVPLTAAVPGTARVHVHALTGQANMACVIHTGGYAELAQAFGALLSWIETNDYAIVGPLREVFLRFGATTTGYTLPAVYLTANQAEFVTELQLPVAKELGQSALGIGKRIKGTSDDALQITRA
jgi:DNA-binding transcriptional MerR regulator